MTPRSVGTARGTVRIRRYRPSDARVVGALTLAAYDAAGGRIEGPYRAHLGDPQRRLGGADAILVAVDVGRGGGDGRIVGTVTYVVVGDDEFEHAATDGDCGFRMLAVDPDAAGRGVGGALVDACIDRARAQGRRRMVILSLTWMRRAHRLYARRGFVRRPDLDIRFPSGIGWAFTLDLVSDAPEHFAPPGPVPPEPPWFEHAWG